LWKALKPPNIIDDIDIDSDDAPLPASSVENNDDDDPFAGPDMPSNSSSPHPYVPSFQPRQLDDIINISDDDLVSSGSDEFLGIDEILSHRKPRPEQVSPPAPARSSSRPVRTRNPTSKQASQNRRKIEKQEKRNRKSKKVDTTQFDEFELPIRSSQ